MKSRMLVGVTWLLLSSCGDSGVGAPRTNEQVCDELCNFPDECYEELGIPVQGSECVQSCVSQAEVVGFDCLAAISDTIACLPSCDVQSLTEEQILACQDEALAISSACE